MKVFLDTNVMMEYFGERKFYKYSREILIAGKQRGISNFVSTGSIYTLAYLLGLEQKRKGIHEPEKTEITREFLDRLTDIVKVEDLTVKDVKRALSNHSFNDLEDSLQYQCAISNDCDVLVSINLKDFKNAEGNIEVLSPQDFCDKYLE